MAKHFPRCPICKSEANYSVSPSNTVVQCDKCKAKFMSEDFKDVSKGLTRLSLFSVPTELIDESAMASLKLLKDQRFPVSFWLGREYARCLPRCPMCQLEALDAQTVSDNVTLLTCLRCGAIYKFTLVGSRSEIVIQDKGSDPRKTGLRLEDLQKITSPESWREFDKKDIETARYCEKCNKVMLYTSLTFRVGRPSSILRLFELVGGYEIGLGDHLTEVFLTLDMYACPECHQIVFYLPKKGEKAISTMKTTEERLP